MENEIKNIELALQTCDEPQTLASYLTRLAAYTSFFQERLKKILIEKPEIWLTIQGYDKTDNEEFPLAPKEKPLSDKKTDMIWASTNLGKQETEIVYTIKRLEVLYKSINKRLWVLEVEYRSSKSQV